MAKRKHQRKSKARASWKGMLQFGLVSVPVEAFNAHSNEAGAVAFHQLHAPCHSRIHYEKVCPVHGEVPNKEIVSGYEYSKGRYVEIETDELDALRTQKERSLSIDSFVPAEEIDPIYLDGRMYYLAPANDPAREPYAVLLEALRRTGRYGIGQVVFSGKEQLVLVRPYEDALHMAMLNFEPEIKRPDELVGELPRIGKADRNVRLAEQLIEALSEDEIDLGRYEDKYLEKVHELIDAKVEGREIVAPTEEEEPEVLNPMDALRKSLHVQQRPQTTHRKRTTKSKRRRAS